MTTFNATQLIRNVDVLRTDMQPLSFHHAKNVKADVHTRELYATALAAVILSKNSVSETESRLYGMILAAMQLEGNQAKYLDLAQRLDQKMLKDFFKAVLDYQNLGQAFFMDALMLARLDSPISEAQNQLLAEVADSFKFSHADVQCAVDLVQYSMGLGGDIKDKIMADYWTFHGLAKINAFCKTATAALKKEFLYSNGVWLDTRHNLMWSRVSIGQTMSNGKAQGSAKEMHFSVARDSCEQLSIAGLDGWRLPTTGELRTIMLSSNAGYDCPQGALIAPQHNDFGVYWSSSFSESMYGLAKLTYASFRAGGLYAREGMPRLEHIAYYARAVRKAS